MYRYCIELFSSLLSKLGVAEDVHIFSQNALICQACAVSIARIGRKEDKLVKMCLTQQLPTQRTGPEDEEVGFSSFGKKYCPLASLHLLSGTGVLEG
jgi:hypothetical protein